MNDIKDFLKNVKIPQKKEKIVDFFVVSTIHKNILLTTKNEEEANQYQKFLSDSANSLILIKTVNKTIEIPSDNDRYKKKYQELISNYFETGKKTIEK